MAIRTATLPKWWAIVNVVLAVVLVIGPIGWAGLIFGMPLWTLVHHRPAGARPAAAPAGSPPRAPDSKPGEAGGRAARLVATMPAYRIRRRSSASTAAGSRPRAASRT